VDALRTNERCTDRRRNSCGGPGSLADFAEFQSRQKSEAIESQMNELRRDLQSVRRRQAKSTGQLKTIAKGVAQRLDSVTPA